MSWGSLEERKRVMLEDMGGCCGGGGGDGDGAAGDKSDVRGRGNVALEVLIAALAEAHLNSMRKTIRS